MKNLSVFFLFISMALMSCSEEESRARNIQIRLTDAPGDYEEVNVDLLRIEAHASGGNDVSGWFELNTNAGVYDLLKFTNGLDTLIVDDVLPDGKITQIRMVLGDNNSVVIDGETHALTIPSAAYSGLKFNVHTDFLEGITYKILLDFDAGRSVVLTGNGKYQMKPVIRTITEAQDGGIQGTVVPADLSVAVMAILGTDTISTYSDTTGGFLIRAVPAGTYKVLFQPGQNYEPHIIENVVVTDGRITEVDAVEF